MKTVFYSAIRPAEGQAVADIIRKARSMGYMMTIFNGWTDADLGARVGENKGPSRDAADANAKILMEIQDACEVSIDGQYDFPHILQTVVSDDDIKKGYGRA